MTPLRTINQQSRAEFDNRLRKSAFAIAIFAVIVTFTYTFLPLEQDSIHQQALRLLDLAAAAVLLLAILIPWERIRREWFMLGMSIALPFIAATVEMSGGWSSPFQAYYYFSIVFYAAYSLRRRLTLIFNAAALAFSLSSILFDPDIAAFSKRVIVNAAVFFALGLVVDIIVQEGRRQERRIGQLTSEQRSNERETARLAALQRAGLLINSRLNAREAMEALVHELATTLGYPLVTMYLREAGDTPILVASAGYPDHVAQVPLPNSVVERVYRTGNTVLMRDVGKTTRRIKTAPGVRSIVSVPVHDADGITGVLTVEDTRDLDERDLELLELFAHQADAALTNARRYAEESQRAMREEALREVALVLTSTLDRDIVLREVLDQLARVLPSDGAAVLTRADDERLRIATTRGMFASDTLLADGINPSPYGIAEQIARTNTAHLLPAYFVEETPESIEGIESTFPAWIGSLIAAPLLVDGSLRGVILVAAQQRGRYGSADADLVADFARHAAVALRNAELHDALAQTARTDPLTGMLNHGALLAALGIEVARAERYRHTLSVLFFDLDRFKAINDTHGHQFGDKVLIGLARLARETLRHVDIVGRYGGEEFVAILPETDYAQAMVVAERLRKLVASTPFAEAPSGGVVLATVSVGVATYPLNGQSVNDLIRVADGALYHAKRHGRDRVSGSQELLLTAD